MKRGRVFHSLMNVNNHDATAKDARLVLTSDGRTLQVFPTKISPNNDLSVPLQVIPLGTVCSLNIITSLRFAIEWMESSGQSVDCTPQLTVVETASSCIAQSWVISLACGVSAFKTAGVNLTGSSQLPDPVLQLLSQAVRLRIFEIATVVGLPEAIEEMQSAYGTTLARHVDYEVPSFRSVSLLHLPS